MRRIIRDQYDVVAVAAIIIGLAIVTTGAVLGYGSSDPATILRRATVLVTSENGSQGSAIVISERMALSARHVCLMGQQLTLTDYEGRSKYAIQVKVADADESDACIIYGDFSELPSVRVASSGFRTDLPLPVITSGFPYGDYKLGLADLVTSEQIYLADESYGIVQLNMQSLSVDCFPGNSGGGVLRQDAPQELVGIVSARDPNRGVCFVTPLESIKALLDEYAPEY